MRIHVVGGGPAGLYFSIQMKKLDPAHHITVFERDGHRDTYGWGIVFSDRTLDYLMDTDHNTYVDITNRFETWDNVDIIHRGQKVSVRGNKFSGIARIAFLNILRRRCQELGVLIRYQTQITELDTLSDCDLLVGSDGANSLVRTTFADAFQPTLDVRKNKYLWLGVDKVFDGLTLILRQHDSGHYVAHAYKFNPTTSTFIVECIDDTWEKVGFENMSDSETCDYLEDIFRHALEGHRLLHNDFVKWLNFVIVKNKKCFHNNVVLLGDALHTAHFSIGSGTKLAVEDAISLAECFRRYSDVSRALPEFQRVRKPVIDELQAAAESSMKWLEDAKSKFPLEPIPLAYELMTRSTKIDYEKLSRRDPDFIAAYDRWRASTAK
jgi:anthraniloyl-CoA monooxygenase